MIIWKADLNKSHSPDIQSRPTRIDLFDTGYSYEINTAVLRLIEDGGLLIAELTCGNPNVCQEIGYLSYVMKPIPRDLARSVWPINAFDGFDQMTPQIRQPDA